MKKFLLSLLCLISFMAINAETKTIDVTFSNYTAGTQYAKNEAHVINESLTIYTTECHFTTELRIYSSSTHNGYAVSNELPGAITQMTFNAGNKKDVLNVYGSTDGRSWKLVEGISITSTSYKDYSLDFPANSSYTYFKLDVKGDQQIRIKKMSVTYTTSTGGGEEPGEGGGEEPGDDPVVPETPSLPEGTLYYESFDKCAGTGGNDSVWKAISGTPAIQFDNANNTHVKGYGASQCARFGTGSALGSFTTAALTGLGSVQGGYAIITFKAAAWNGDSNTIEVSIAGGGEFIAETSLTTKDAEWTEYSLGIAGGTANTTITISAVEESGNRFFLDEVKVMASTKETVTGIEDTMVDENAPVEYYNLQGVKVANPENGIFIKKQGGRTSKVVL